jgi:hypothetical protein
VRSSDAVNAFTACVFFIGQREGRKQWGYDHFFNGFKKLVVLLPIFYMLVKKMALTGEISANIFDGQFRG